MSTEIEVKKIRKKEDSLLARCTVPTSETMKAKLDTLKQKHGIDINAMTREYWQLLIDRLNQS
jgi:hypothetical protein